MHFGREDISVAIAEAPFRANPKMLQDALMKATIEHFGEKAVCAQIAKNKGVEAKTISLDDVQTKAGWSMHLTLLFMLVVGGLLAS